MKIFLTIVTTIVTITAFLINLCYSTTLCKFYETTKDATDEKITIDEYKSFKASEVYEDVEKLMISAKTISVSSLKTTWSYTSNHDYNVLCMEANKFTKYANNIRYVYSQMGVCYITGLRENTNYKIIITDLTEKITEVIFAKTEQVTVIETFEHEDGPTNYFAYEAASGLTDNPSRAAIAGAIQDPITDTGIMRNEYGDYCVAMGLFYGKCNDRFLIELNNGVQFTVKICDSKGLGDKNSGGKYHKFGDGGKCIIEFIHSYHLPERVTITGNYGSYDWDGLDLDDVKLIQKIDYGSKIEY